MSVTSTLVAYYSNTGSNKYLAEQIAERLECDMEEIRPHIGSVPVLIACSWLGIPVGIRPFRHSPAQYDRLIICGPIWAGQLVAPLRDTIKKYRSTAEEMYMVTCCGSRDADADGKFGYNTVFDKARKVARGKLKTCTALPVSLVLPEDIREDPDAVMQARLTKETFNGEVKQRFDALIQSLQTHKAEDAVHG